MLNNMPTPFTKEIINQVRTVPINMVLASVGILPLKEYFNRYEFDCPLHTHLDKDGNRIRGGFCVYKSSNRYQCFVTSKDKSGGGSVIDIHMAVCHKDITESISILMRFLPIQSGG